MYPAPFTYERPRTLLEAAQILARLGPDAKVLAGGQTLIPMMKLRLVKPQVIVDIGHIDEARGLSLTGTQLEIGALTTHATVANSPEAERFPILRDCAGGIADAQVRSMGTIAGSLAEADPSSCWPTLLTALDASVHCISVQGERVQPVRTLLRDAYAPALAPSELIYKVVIDTACLAGSGAFVAFKRAAAAYPTASCALQLQLQGDTIASARMALGCVGLTPLAVDVTSIAAGQPVTPALVDKVATYAAMSCDPLADNKGTAEYKRALVQGLVRRAFRIVASRLAGHADLSPTHTYYG